MKNTVISFTDAHGVTHTGAVFELTYGCKNDSKIETIGQSGGDQQMISVNYQFKYWHSQEAKEAGLQPMSFMDKGGQQTFGTYLSSDLEITALEDYCIAQLIETVLPTIDPTATVVTV